ncbi:TVP38/TMEM64 family protein [Alkalicoccus saliphilus]|jgi:uncharacterized membrane protein YdjX (TVP38/TMEM64 family)|uniref:TVP38/TMEM64 family membrane protein n=1 Tax=Alkalicoccus saliphilus TaxID=200989 RepID=A0A2T4UA88_9BACI|nr:TVP38/TMEM64 family protein [Alkalicoccus saliphilus]PTL40318.1 TVP38/TMEM64 family protein [Alkalicoccus saliphilus]
MNLRFVLKAVLFGGIIGLLIYINQEYLNVEAEEIQEFLLSFGLLAPVVFVIIYTIRPFFLFPSSMLAVAGGLAFGPFIGPAATYAGSLSGAVISFLVIRKLGGSKKLASGSTGSQNLIRRRIEDNGFFYIVSLRIIPVINFDLVSYLSAVSRIRFKTYIAATSVGIIPGTIAFNLLGASIADLSPGLIAVTAAVFAVALAIPVVVRKMLQKRNLSMDDVTRKQE